MTTPQNQPAFVLEAPAPVAPVAPKDAVAAIQVNPAALTAQETKARQFAADLAAMDHKSPQFGQIIEGISTVGAEQITKASQVSNRMLDRPAIQGAPDSPPSKVGKSLVDLRNQVTELDPSRADLTGIKKVFKFLPGGRKVENYFRRYESAQDQLDAILKSLEHGQDELRKDNASLEVERTHMWETMGILSEQSAYLDAVDKALTEKIDQCRAQGLVEQATALDSDARFAVRQRIQDIETQMAVNVQGYLAMDLIKKNNSELVRGVERAKTTTLAALRTAVMISQALGQQAIVLAQIKGLNETTGNMIASSAAMLRQQGAEINRQAAEATIDPEKLTAAWNDVSATLDEVDEFKMKANESMKQTFDSLREQNNEARPHLERSARTSGHIQSAPAQPAPAQVTQAPQAPQAPKPTAGGNVNQSKLNNLPW